MDILNEIDWHNHDGVNLPMINDFMRNQFYDRVLSRHVAGKHCTDVGFGTGLLTMIALKHGAAHVRAFESDYHRYHLGVEIIRRLDLGSQIELINDRYDHNHTPTSITFSETVNGNLWWEGLWNSLPVGAETKFLPGEYFLELWATVVPDAFAQGLTKIGQTQQYFSPGVELDYKFIDVVNSFRNAQSPMAQSLPNGIVHFERQQETDWGWIPYMRAVQAGSVIARYSASNTSNIEEFVLEVDTQPWKNQTVLIVPRMGMQQDTDRLYLDTGHWGPGENPVLLVCPQQRLVVKHSVKTGIITYSLE
jgi:hypothetical protein